MEVRDEDGGRWWSETLDLTTAPEIVEISLDVVWVEGSVTLGGEPLAAKLEFGGRYGMRHIVIPTDNIGAFAGYLPEAGPWRIHVAAEAPRVRRGVKVLVEPTFPGGPARIDIELPATRLLVHVVDEDGEPTQGLATLRSLESPEERPVEQETDEDGDVEFAGLFEGAHRLEAFGEAGLAEPIDVELSEKRPDREVTLRLEAIRRLTLSLLSDSGPVVGGYATVLPADSLQLGGVARLPPKADGTVVATLPKSTTAVLVTAGVPGYSFEITRLAVPEDRAALSLSRDGGTLEVRVPADNAQDAPGVPWVAYRNGGLAFWGELVLWARSNGQDWSEGRIEIPNLAPGLYTLCLMGDSYDAGAVYQGRSRPARCRTVGVYPGGFSQLELATTSP